MKALCLSVLLLGACASAPQSAPEALRVGVGVTDITPPADYPMSGYYHERLNTGIRDRLHAKAFVFRQGGERAALVVCDVCGVSAALSNETRRRAALRTGIPAANIVVAATHTHTGPDYDRDLKAHLAGTPTPGERGAYIGRLIDAIAQAAIDADAKAAPLRLQAGIGTQASEISFNRRFVMKDGLIKTWANFKDPNVVRAAGPIDPAVNVLLLRDGAGKAVASLTNFALHLDTLSGTKYSADYPCDLEESLRSDFGKEFVSIFGNGCCGDINHVDPRSDQRNKTDFIGQALAASVKAAIPLLADVASPSLAVRRAVVDAPLQVFSKDEVEWAKGIIEQDRAGKKIPFLDEVKAYKIMAVEALDSFKNTTVPQVAKKLSTLTFKFDDPLTLPLEVHVIRLGADTAIVTLPGEVFVDLGLAIKKASPFKNTFVVELANVDDVIYIPTKEQFAGGGYEVTNSTLKPGRGELLVEAAVRLLRELKP